MSEPRQLIVLGSSLTALAVVRNARALGLRVVLVDQVRGVAHRSRCINERLLVEAALPETLLPSLERLAAALPTALVADSDDWLSWIYAQRHSLESAGLVVLHPANDVLATCLDKRAFAAWCDAHGFPAPRRYELVGGEAPETIEYPVFVRPRLTRHADLSAVPKAAVARDPVELEIVRERFDRIGVPVVVSRSLLAPGLRQFSYGFARRADGAQCGLVTEKLRPWPDQCATGSLVVTAQAPQLLDLGQRVADALDFVGIGEVELLHNDRSGETHVIEVNARPWLQYALAIRSGRDLLRFHLRPHSYDAARESDAPLRWLSMASDLFHCFSRKAGLIRRGKLSWGDWWTSLQGPRVWAAWSWHDPLPALSLARRTARDRVLPATGRSTTPPRELDCVPPVSPTVPRDSDSAQAALTASRAHR